jgi:putative ABC transport system permease protein
MLRTIGMTRRQARRMIRHDSVITTLIGAALGVRGISLAMLVKRALSRYDIAISIPIPDLVAFTAAMAASTTLTQIDTLRGVG